MGPPLERKRLMSSPRAWTIVSDHPASRQGLRGIPVCSRRTLAVGPERNLGLGPKVQEPLYNFVPYQIK